MASKNVAENEAFRRNYRRVRNIVWEATRPFGRRGDFLARDIYGMVRERFGCRATEIPDADIEAALAFTAQIGSLVGCVRGAVESLAREETREREQAPASYDVFDMVRHAYRLRTPPDLRLVPNCGSWLRTHEANEPTAPSAG